MSAMIKPPTVAMSLRTDIRTFLSPVRMLEASAVRQSATRNPTRFIGGRIGAGPHQRCDTKHAYLTPKGAPSSNSRTIPRGGMLTLWFTP